MRSIFRAMTKVNLVNVCLVVALVFAMTGGAYAARHYIITSTKQIKPSVLKQLQGKQGPAGVSGSNGKDGAPGANGSNGKDGGPGVAGESVTSKEIKVGEAGCNKLGGSEFAVGGKTTSACNGQTGYTETIPKGKTLKGDWSIAEQVPGTGFVEGGASTAVGFGIPLAEAPEAVSYVKEGEATPSGCTGDVSNPGAEPGHLCVFAAFEFNGNVTQASICPATAPVLFCIAGTVEPGADPSGFVIGVVDSKEKGLIAANGTWAVTAE